MNKLLSIVIPVYKVEAYIRKCLDSCIVSDPSLMNLLEVIIVNDGTPDRSAEISREYVEKYPGIFRQIDKENGGHGSAWNVGLKEAAGRYLRFLDSDDWLTNLEKFLNYLAGVDADIVFTQHMRWYSETGTRVLYVNPTAECILSKIHSGMWGCSEFGYANINFWNVTYRTDILKPLLPLFAEGVMYDDYILTCAPLLFARTYASLDIVLYNYLIGRAGQSMSISSMRRRAESYKACLSQYEVVLSRIGLNHVPEDLRLVINASVAGYAHYIFHHMLGLTYSDAKKEMSYIQNTYPWENGKSQVFKRYSKLPFPIFYFFERGRIIYRHHKK